MSKRCSLSREQATKPARSPELPAPEVDVMDAPGSVDTSPWHLLLFNDDIHTFDEVIMQLMKAISCSATKAQKMAWTVHTEGKVTVMTDTFEECLRAEGVLAEIGLVTEIRG